MTNERFTLGIEGLIAETVAGCDVTPAMAHLSANDDMPKAGKVGLP